MKTTAFAATLLALCASLASAGVVITPIHADQVVAKSGGDCFFGVSTPSGCGPLRG
ncbi:Uu.00g117590.m01.CDS01 [Anthostomella pinea]|uniref:Uu.00g117590.m01.CDS01 n=1 Tax=Anthostomella pinea TaxID=933095 RepID=A0AAI8YGV1_9PEZI|nr:Uu.00g117590.m01.CDS01 [Anthostomella pinea]